MAGSSCRTAFVIVVTICFLGAFCAPGSAQLTRQEAVQFLLDPGSGVLLDPSESVVWSPFQDYGFGAGMEGLLAAGSTVGPELENDPPLAPGNFTLSDDRYFFWSNDLPTGLFAHPTRILLVEANNPAPTVANGGILETHHEWWPVIEGFGGQVDTLYASLEERVSDLPPAYDNPDGLILGTAHGSTILSYKAPRPGRGAPIGKTSSACALTWAGDKGEAFQNDIESMEQDLREVFGVPPERIFRAHPEGKPDKPGSDKDLCDAIDRLCAIADSCDTIYIRISTHGQKSGLKHRNGKLTKKKLCQKLQQIAKKGKPIHMLINACHSGALVDGVDWEFPPGSSIITVAEADKCGWGDARFTDPENGEEFDGSPYPRAFAKCLRDPAADADGNGAVDDAEAHDWIVEQRPCYVHEGENYYIAGPPDGVPDENGNPNPQKRLIGFGPGWVGLNVCNNTEEPKTDFHMVFRGDVTGGDACAWFSFLGDIVDVGGPWAKEGITINYDPVTNETMVCFDDPDWPVQPGEYRHFSYRKEGALLRPLRYWWTPTDDPTSPDPEDQAPGQDGTAQPGDKDYSFVDLDLVVRNLDQGGWDEPVSADVFVRASPVLIPPENLNLGDPMVASLPVTALGSYLLAPDQPLEFLIPAPSWPEDYYGIVEIHQSWLRNGTTTIQLFEYSPFATSTGTPPPTPEPTRAGLAQNRPNPFNPRTVIPFRAEVAGLARIEILDVRGRQVQVLTHRAQVGWNEVVWDGRDRSGAAVASGVYHARLLRPGEAGAVKMVLVR